MTDRVNVSITWGAPSTVPNDVRDRIRGSISVSYGRASGSALDTTVAGSGSLTLDNSSRDYSPLNTASPVYGYVKPARPVTITRTVGATTYTIAAMHTDDSPINPDVSAKTTSVSMVDYMADFRGKNVTTDLFRGIRTGTAIGKILDAVGWTGGRDIDGGATIMPWWWLDNVDAFDAMTALVASEGAPALLTVTETGGILFRGRHHRLTRSGSNTLQGTWRGRETDPEPVMAPGFLYNSAWSNVVNDVTFSVQSRVPNPKIGVVWSSDTPLSFLPGQTRTINIHTEEPFMEAIDPVFGVDVIGGAVFVSDLSRYSGQSTSIRITAPPILGQRHVTKVQLRARSVPSVDATQVSASDTASIADYGSRGAPSGAEPVWAGPYDAQAIADLLVLQRAQPLPIVTVRFNCAASTVDRLSRILVRDLSDRIRIIEAETTLNADFFIESIAHVIQGLVEHEVTFQLEGVPAQPAVTPFIIGTSAIGGTDVLGI